MSELTAGADIRGRAIALALAWSDPAGKPRSLRLARSRWGYPTSPADGLAVVDLAELFTAGGAPWAIVERQRHLLVDARAEGGALQIEIASFYAGAGDPEPSRVSITAYDARVGAALRTVIDAVTRVATDLGSSATFGLVTTLTIYASPGGGPEAPAGTVVISTQALTPGPTTEVDDYTQPDPSTGEPPLVTKTAAAPGARVDWTPAARAVTGASHASPIAISTAHPHGLSSGATVTIGGVGGNGAANGVWAILVTGATTFTLIGSAGSGAYTGGGAVLPAPASLPFSIQERQRTAATRRATDPLEVAFVTHLVGAGAPDLALRITDYREAADADSGDLNRSITVLDREPPGRAEGAFVPGLAPGVAYYYAAWQDGGAGYPAAPAWSASSVATDDHAFSERLFASVPAVHRYYDDPASGPQIGTGEPGSWQLRRFLQVLGPALDQARSLGEGLRALHDVLEVRADFLPHLGRMIGWEVDRTLPTQHQRTDILYAPDVFATVGTLANIEALVHRSTGWTCRAKEFVANVFLTNFVEAIRLQEIWQAPPTAGPLALPVAQTIVTRAVNDSADGRPAIALEPTDGSLRLFWHSTRADGKSPPSARRQLWTAPLDGTSAPRPVMQGAPDDADGLTYADEWPAAIADGSVIRLFWCSDRGGTPGIWTRTLTAGVPGDATRLTKHAAGDRCPAVARDAGGSLWLFWHSARRGPTDIWAMKLAPGATDWSRPMRITSGRPRDRMPAAFVDAASRLNLLWSADLGDRARIVRSTFDGTSWSAPDAVSADLADPALFRDEAPAAVQLGATAWAFWTSNRDGVFRLRAAPQVGAGWGPSDWVTKGRHEETEPAAFVDAASKLRLVFATKQSGEAFRSRTVDFSDLGAIKRGSVEDRWHYTYSTATDPDSYYARDTVGLYIKPGLTANLDDADRVVGLVEPFRPLPVRFIWFVEPADTVEEVYAKVDIAEGYLDSAEYLGPIDESYAVALPQWSVLHTNTPGHVSVNPADLTTLWHRVFYPAPT